MSSGQDLEAVIEAILFVSSEPVSRDRLLEVFDRRQQADAQAAITAVTERYSEARDRGFMIDEVAGGLRLVTRPDLHGYLRRFYEVSGQTKLSMAALETLAIIAYRQPVTGPEIQELRSVSSSGVLKTLLERRLVRIAGRKEVVGKPFLYATTREFLMHFGLRTLKDLPPLEAFEELYATEGGDLDSVGPDHEETVLREAADLEEAREGQEHETPDDGTDAESEEAGEHEAPKPEAPEPEAEDPERSEDCVLFKPTATAEIATGPLVESVNEDTDEHA